MSPMLKSLLSIVCGLTITIQTEFLSAQGPHCVNENANCIGGECNNNHCGPCKVTCKGSVEPGTISRHYWDVECDYVCIPPVRFPWMKCCDLPCPKIRQIHVMKKHKYKINVCNFHWKLNKTWSCFGGKCVTK